MIEEAKDIRIPILKFILERGFRDDGDMCICTAGREKCGRLTSIWSGLADTISDVKHINRDRAFELMRNRSEGLYSQLNNLKDNGILIRKGARSMCVKQDDIDSVGNAVNENNITTLVGEDAPEIEESVEEVETRESVTILPFMRPQLRQERGSHWKIKFSPEFWNSVRDVWDKTSDTGREHQLALCLAGENIIGGNSYVGEAESVAATDRDFICPDHTVKVGALHTHPPDVESLRRRGLDDEKIEQAMVQSMPDLDVTIKFNDPIACTTSMRSTNCMINHSDFLPRELFRDLMSGTSRGVFTRDKNRLMGEMIRRGILKHRSVNDAIMVKSPKSIECKQEDDILKCSILGSVGIAQAAQIEAPASGIYLLGVEDSFKLDSDGNPTHLITPYVAEEASCWKGFDDRVWCDAHESMDQTTMSKKILEPLYEKRIWEILNKEITGDVQGAPVWTLLNNYITILKTSIDRFDQDKGSLILGIMGQYATDSDINKFVSGILGLIQIT